MMLKITRLSRNRVDLKIRGGGAFRGRAAPTASLSSWLSSNGIDTETITVILDKAEDMKPGDAISVSVFPPTAEPEQPFTVFIRERLTDKESIPLAAAGPMNALKAALEDARPFGDIRWLDRNKLCVLDLDAHDCSPISKGEAMTLPEKLQTRPTYMWLSKNRGLHMIYGARDGFTAYERACAGAIEVYAHIPRLSAELLTNTRYPPKGVKPLKLAATDGSRLNVWRSTTSTGQVTDEEKLDWMSEQGLSYGRYPHTNCPFDPCEIGGRDPVDVGPEGISCFRCRGVSATKGWISWERLLSGDTTTRPRIEDCALARVPWEHARHVISEDWKSPLRSSILRNGYRILSVDLAKTELKSHAMRVTQEFGIVRGSGGTWLDSENFSIIVPKVGQGRIQALPGVFVKGRKGATASGVLTDRYMTNQPLRGWPEVIPVRGLKLWRQEQDKRYVYPVTTPRVKYPPVYVAATKRQPFSDCVAFLRAKLPGLDERYLALCILARAYAESGEGAVPILLVTGPTGAGKSAIVKLAATMVGDGVYIIPDNAALEETIGYGSSHAGFLLWDEYGKGNVYGRKESNMFDPVLRMEREYTFRMLYMGPMRVRLNCVVVITNTQYSSDALSHQQAARRMAYLPLTRRVKDWRKVGEITQLRNDRLWSSMFDDYLSWLTDDYLEEPLPWDELINDLGFNTLEDYNRVGIEANLDSTVLAFFKEVKDDPSYVDDGAWIAIPFNSPAGELWLPLADGHEGAKMAASTRVRERDLMDLLEYGGEFADDRAIRFSSQRYSDGIKISVILTGRHSLKQFARNQKVLDECSKL